MIGRTNTGGGGGGGLNFSVVGGTTAPSSPKENMIWINTDQKITSWIFSATEPESPVEGMAWITIGTSSTVEFNALKKNGLQVYPISAKQYIGGAWVDKTAMSYQNGEWVEWVTYLYNKGDECVDITSGWELSTDYTGAYSHGDTLTKNEASMVFTSTFQMNVHNAYGFLRANNKINLTSKNTIDVNFNSFASINGVPLYLCIKEKDIAANNMIASVEIRNGDKNAHLDISLYNGEYYVGIAAGNAEGSSSVDVGEVIIS